MLRKQFAPLAKLVIYAFAVAFVLYWLSVIATHLNDDRATQSGRVILAGAMALGLVWVVDFAPKVAKWVGAASFFVIAFILLIDSSLNSGLLTHFNLPVAIGFLIFGAALWVLSLPEEG